jgi:hypothetical protein
MRAGGETSLTDPLGEVEELGGAAFYARFGDERARSMASLDEPAPFEHIEGLADRSPIHTEFLGEESLCADPIAGVELTLLDPLEQGVDDLHVDRQT